jgi:hypothetical protein
VTSYFNEYESAVRDLSRIEQNNELFVRDLSVIEADVVAMVSLVTGDREFPDEWRERIQGCIACQRLYINDIPNQQAIGYARTVRASSLLADLHSLFHRLASERIKMRFGLLTDSPLDILKRRDAHDKET